MALTHAWHDYVHDFRDEMHDLATITRVDAARQAYLGLWATAMALPLLFGLDRFVGVMNEGWNGYVAGWADSLLPGGAGAAIATFGVVELVLFAAVAAMPRIGGDLLALWLVLQAINLFALGDLHWVAVGCLGLAVACLAMARMSTAYHHREG
ncbi:hypothetical protein [Nocardioides coralli]|uniref:hypothetical protein n=1 Tax=Nocardioides coralli TaxID=2872154 RepID=UPI001CA42EBD|nr:hypothetical protein [Nocardioides coralli]QZY30356.1 hypothetical protein K6T13_06775 [Nocardioides coralli]